MASDMTTAEFLARPFSEIMAGGAKPLDQRIESHVQELALLRNFRSMIAKASKPGRTRAPDRSGPRASSAPKASKSAKPKAASGSNGKKKVADDGKAEADERDSGDGFPPVAIQEQLQEA